ncbi:MAG TPA: hypothetical protein VFJ16_19635 [Longimicrobium sp.]|nr:hypothetical protein [Longimicrobium sp.]
MRSILLALATMLLAAPAAAQHCWPSIVVLIVRDANGSIIDPARLDSIEYAPKRLVTADFRVRPIHVDTASDQSFERGPTPVLAWYGQGDCRVDIREVVLRRGTEAMRLWMDLHVDTEENPGPSYFSLNTPPFATGTWRLDVCGVPPGQSGKYASIPPRWAHVSAPGGSDAPWQGPAGCQGRARP